MPRQQLPKPPYDDLTPAETYVLEACKAGHLANLGQFPSDERLVRARLVQWLCTHSANKDVVLTAIGLHGCRLDEDLDLSFITLATPFALTNSQLKAVHFVTSRTRDLSFSGSWIEGLTAPRAHVEGALDLSHVQLKGEFYLPQAVIDGEVLADDARFSNPSGVAIQASSVRARNWTMANSTVQGLLVLVDATITGDFLAPRSTFQGTARQAVMADGLCANGWFTPEAAFYGGLQIANAQFRDNFVARKATFASRGGRALFAESSRASGWDLEGSTFEGQLFFSAMKLRGALDLTEISVDAASGIAIGAAELEARSLLLSGSNIRGSIVASRARLESSIVAASLSVAGSLNLPGLSAASVEIWKSSIERIDLEGAIVRGDLSISETQVGLQPEWVALDLTNARVGSALLSASTLVGALHAPGIKLDHGFFAVGASFEAMGVAILAFSASGTSFMMRSSEQGRKCVVTGAIDLAAATLDEVDFDASEVRSAGGYAIRLDRARVRNVLTFGEGFASIGAIVLRMSEVGIARFKQSRISAITAGGHEIPHATANARAERLAHQFRHIAIDATDATIKRLILPDTPPRGIVDLTRADIGTLEDFVEGWFPPLHVERRPNPERLTWEGHDLHGTPEVVDLTHLVIDGTVYESLEHPDGDSLANSEATGDARESSWGHLRWRREIVSDPAAFLRWWRIHRADGGTRPEAWQRRLLWLMSQGPQHLTDRFNPQPWKQLARVLATMGYEQDARHIAVQRRVMQRAADRLPPRRALSWLLHVLADYGFNPWKTILWSVVIVFLCGTLFAAQGECWSSCVLVSGETAVGDFFAVGAGNVLFDNPPQHHYPEFSPWLYSLDQFIPVLSLGMDEFWRPKSEALYVLAVIEQFVGAFLVALAVTGFTGLLTQDEHIR